ncbi:MAG: DNA repair protein RadA [Bacteroidaceae bacterium]|nr:DNA repair protein RadA [Bacteroidaceae bacterium]
MAKDKIAYVCSSCGYDSPKWIGKCPACGEWNTFSEYRVGKKAPATVSSEFRLDVKSSPISMSKIETADEPRINMQDGELNRVLGGGLVPGSMTLLGGEPGIGKSTLILQTVMRLKDMKVLYVSGEESARQLKLRADRLNTNSQTSNLNSPTSTLQPQLSNLQPQTSNLLVVCEAMIEIVFEHIKAVEPDLVVIDSIQTMATETVESSPGSVTQIRECAAMLLKYAKESNTPVIVIGHINKEGTIAGPKILEHMVDTVLQFEGDQHYMYRIVRAIKNRFGSTAELGIYEMVQSGLRPVENPSELLLSDVKEGEELSGVAVACSIEGVRPLLIETQALVSTAAYGTPQRSATGFDLRRLNMLLAVLEKRVGFKLPQRDVFLNIAGGIRVTDPAIDLSVIAAVLSSNVDTGIPRDICFAGEVGLSGEVRPVSRILQRIAEADKLGFRKIIVPKANMNGLDASKFKIKIVPVRKVEEALRELFG